MEDRRAIGLPRPRRRHRTGSRRLRRHHEGPRRLTVAVACVESTDAQAVSPDSPFRTAIDPARTVPGLQITGAMADDA